MISKAYSRRQLIAIERADEHDRAEQCSGDVFKREIEIVEVGKRKLQLVSTLHVNLDDMPEWDAAVSFLEGGLSDHPVHQRAWTSEMWEAANRVMRELITLPREVYGVKSKWKTRARPSEWHVIFPVTALERDWITAIRCGGIAPSVRALDPKDRTRRVG